MFVSQIYRVVGEFTAQSIIGTKGLILLQSKVKCWCKFSTLVRLKLSCAGFIFHKFHKNLGHLRRTPEKNLAKSINEPAREECFIVLNNEVDHLLIILYHPYSLSGIFE